MKKLAEVRGCNGMIYSDSAGTIGYHEGELCDRRAYRAAKERGYIIDHVARQITRADLETFDYILVMDRNNLRDIEREFRPTEIQRDKIRLLLSFCPDCETDEVPDPYYGGPEGFDVVLDLVERACSGLIEHLAVRK